MEKRISLDSKGLSLDKLSKIKIISFDDYGKGLHSNIDFPSGAHEIRVILGRDDNFINVKDFFLHISCIPFARCTHFDFPSDFEDRKYTFQTLSKKEIDKYVNSYIEGFFEHLYPISITLDLWKLSLNIKDFEEGYKLETQGTEQVLICKTTEYYLYFISQSID
jgi:hypothetical protein